MKFKGLLVVAAALLFSTASFAQEQGDMRANAGINYLTKPFDGDATIGFGGGFEYVFADKMSGVASYHTHSKDGNTIGIFAIDYRYYFVGDGGVQVYGNAGMSFVSVTGGSGNGFNLGVGTIIPVSDNIGINAGLKYEMQEAATFTGTKRLGLAVSAGATFMF